MQSRYTFRISRLSTPSPMSLPPSNGRKALITGITGQDGSYLAELLLAKGYECGGWCGAARPRTALGSRICWGRIQPADASVPGRPCRLAIDLPCTRSVATDEVYNLAAQSHVHVSFECRSTPLK